MSIEHDKARHKPSKRHLAQLDVWCSDTAGEQPRGVEGWLQIELLCNQVRRQRGAILLEGKAAVEGRTFCFT